MRNESLEDYQAGATVGITEQGDAALDAHPISQQHRDDFETLKSCTQFIPPGPASWVLISRPLLLL